MDNEIQRTLVVLKPDAIQRNLTGEIISRFERVGLKIIAMKLFVPTKDFARNHYAPTEEEYTNIGERSIKGKLKKGVECKDDPTELGHRIVDGLVNFLNSGPVVAMVLEGGVAVKIVRKMVGSTEPLQSDMGTIRGDFTLDSYELADSSGRAVRNLVHASDSPETAKKEIAMWFKEEEIFPYNNSRDIALYSTELKY